MCRRKPIATEMGSLAVDSGIDESDALRNTISDKLLSTLECPDSGDPEMIKMEGTQRTQNHLGFWLTQQDFIPSRPPTYTMSRIPDVCKVAGDGEGLHRRTDRYLNISNMSIEELQQEIKDTLVPLVTETDSSTWRECLIHLVQFSLRDRLTAIVKYFQHLISTAIHVHNVDPTKKHEIPLDSLDMAKPASLSSEQWRKFVLALNLDIEEPDSLLDLKYTSVIVPQDVNLPALEGFLFVLQALIDLGSGKPQVLCQLSSEEGRNIYSLLREVLSNRIIELTYKHPILLPVWVKYTRSRDFLESLGVKQQKIHGLKIAAFPSEGDNYKTLQLAYFLTAALFVEF